MPSALPVVKSVREEGKGQVFKLDEKALEKLLMDPALKDKKVCVVSIAGAFRKGKSFLMNFLLRYLKHASRSPPGEGDWMQPDECGDLAGFKSGGGSELITEGILFWSEPFIFHEQGEQVAVFLMDTQGLYDHKSNLKNRTTIFALSTLLSSVTIYNVSQEIDENDLEQMQLFTEYAKMAVEHGGEKPFQHLMFLVRDWQNRREYAFGPEGGGNYLDKVLQIDSNQAVELQEVRKHIKSSFEKIHCFLMPHPGFTVSEGEFTGDPAGIEYRFKQQLRELVSHLHSGLKPNRVNGESITCAQLFHYFKAYSAMFEGGELPELKSLVQMLAENRNSGAEDKARAQYATEMEAVFQGTVASLPDEHERLKREAIALFDGIQIGGPELSGKYRASLVKGIDGKYTEFEERARARNRDAAKEARAHYVKEMGAICGGDQPYTEDLPAEHERLKREAIAHFDGITIGGPEFSDQFKASLEREIEEEYEELEKSNDAKKSNPLAALLTGVVKLPALVKFAAKNPSKACRFLKDLPWE